MQISKEHLSKRLRKFQKNYTLVDIERQNIDPNPLHGFIINYSETLILLQQVYDIRVNGFKVIRLADITKLGINQTGVFQKAMMLSDGSIKSEKSNIGLPLGNYQKIAETLGEWAKLFSIEMEALDEGDEYYSLGKFIENKGDVIVIHEFDGTAKWDKKESCFASEEITALSFDDDYSKAYERYFKRQKNGT
jgi:hypothetical protein